MPQSLAKYRWTEDQSAFFSLPIYFHLLSWWLKGTKLKSMLNVFYKETVILVSTDSDKDQQC